MKIHDQGYCAVTADFLHIGHINFIMACKDRCVSLTVGIMTDDCVAMYKGKKPYMNQWDRERVIKSLRFVNNTLFQNTFEFPESIIRSKEHQDFIIFDSEEHKRKGADFIIRRTENISSSLIKGHNENINISQQSL